MKTFLGFAILLVCIGCVESAPKSAIGNKSLSTPTSDHRFKVFTETGWILSISPDGSGSLQYGSLAHDRSVFPAGTFDYRVVATSFYGHLQPGGNLQSGVALHYPSTGFEVAGTNYTENIDLVRPLFSKAIVSSSTADTRIPELYKNNPPLP